MHDLQKQVNHAHIIHNDVSQEILSVTKRKIAKSKLFVITTQFA